MSITSGQITRRLQQSTNPGADKQKLFEQTRYFVAQRPAADDFADTIDGYYKGRKVIPGPKANQRLTSVLNVSDVRLMEQTHFIRFVDNKTTDGADDGVREALFTMMSPAEADEYEAALKKLKG